MTTPLLNQAVTMDDITIDDEYITASEFEDATRTVVRTIGSDFKCDVIFAGAGAAIGMQPEDGKGVKERSKVVVLPSQDPHKKMTRKQYAVGQGYANHETMHNLCTDIVGLEADITRLRKEGKKLAARLANGCEDVRIERAAMKLYPGIPAQLSATTDFSCQHFYNDVYPKDNDIVTDFKRIAPVAITWVGRKRMGYTAPYMDKCIALLPQDMLDRVNKWVDMVERVPTGAAGPGIFDQKESFKGSRQIVQMAEMIAKDIDDIEEEEENDGQGGGQPGAGGNKQGGGQGQGGGKGSGAGSKAGSQNGGTGGGGGGAGGVSDDDPDLDPDNTGQLVTALLNQGDGGVGHRPVSTALDLMADKKTKSKWLQDRIFAVPDSFAHYQHLLSQIGGRTATMKRKLERALFAASEADYVSGQRQGRLDVRRHGTDIMKGKENVYRQKKDGQNIETSVSILVDCSGSMQGGRLNLATKVCIALAECFERTPVELEVLGYTAHCVHDAFDKSVRDAYDNALQALHAQLQDARNKTGKTPAFFRRYHRSVPMTMFVMKAFEESLREARPVLARFDHAAMGSTPSGDAVLKASARLSLRKNPKKILLVLTDGEPGAGTLLGDDETAYAKNCNDYVTMKMGINLVGIGIGDDTVKDTFKNWAVIQDIEDLDKAVMDKVAKLIMGENFKVDNADITGIGGNVKDLKRSARRAA